MNHIDTEQLTTFDTTLAEINGSIYDFTSFFILFIIMCFVPLIVYAILKKSVNQNG